MLLTVAEQLMHAATWEDTMYVSFPAEVIGDDTLQPATSSTAAMKDARTIGLAMTVAGSLAALTANLRLPNFTSKMGGHTVK
jgi:hypothetical protein